MGTVLRQYTQHNGNKFDYVYGIAQRKYIIVDRVRYIGKESNNLDDASVLGIDPEYYLEFENPKQFYEWVLTLKPKDVGNKGIPQQALYKIKAKIRKNENLNLKAKVVRILNQEYQQRKQGILTTIIH
ncbi:MAG: hypothetical protein QW364_02825 [Thermoplasmatales archaeon]